MVISLIPALGKAVNQVMTWIKQFVLWIVDLFLKLFATQESSSSGGGGAEDMLMGLGGGEASALAKWLEKIFVAIAVVLIALIVLWVIRFLWRKLRQLAIYLYGQLRHYASSASEDYIDEIEDTRSEGEGRVSFAQQILRRRNARRNLKDLPPREQIRVRYSMLRGKHPEWEQSHTARETLNETSARLYEKARYSSHEVTAQDSETFAEQQGK
jgi:ABC-type multidrug transport system fused ATPase/permease subunit